MKRWGPCRLSVSFRAFTFVFLDLRYKEGHIINAPNAAQIDPPSKEHNNPTVTSGTFPTYDVMNCK